MPMPWTKPVDQVDGHGWAGDTGGTPAPAPTITQRFTRPLAHRWDVQPFTGRPVSTTPGGQWNRGALYRAAMPALSLPPYHAMMDPTWNPEVNDARRRRRRRG